MADYLRVEKPITTDGIRLMYDENRQPVIKHFEMPMAALKGLEDRNTKLPNELKLKIEVVKDTAVKRPLPAMQPTPNSIILTPEQLAKLIDEKIAQAMKQKPVPSAPEVSSPTPPKPIKNEAAK